MAANKHRGTSVDSFLEEEGLLDDAEAVALKRVIAYEIESAMKREHVSKTKMAAKMHTSRSALYRLLDPKNTSITLNTLVKAFHILGKKLKVSFG
jgi:antitoxin HicB